MKRQRFFLAAVATFAFVASCAVPCVCVAQSYGYSEAHGKELVDPMPPTSHIIVRGKPIKLENGLKLYDHKLHGTQIYNVRLENVNFTGCDFFGADFRQAIFVRCNFSRALLTYIRSDEYTTFIDCNFEDAILEAFDATTLTLDQLKATRSYKEKTIKCLDFHWPTDHDFSEFVLDYVSRGSWNVPPPFHQGKATFDAAGLDLTGTVLKGQFTNLSAAQLKQTENFKKKRYENISFLNWRIPYNDYRKFDFSGSILARCYFPNNTDLSDADFTDAILYDCVFEGPTSLKNPSLLKQSQTLQNSLTLDQLKSTGNWKIGRMDLIKLPPELQAQVDAALAKEAAQATEAKASPEPQSETATAPETK